MQGCRSVGLMHARLTGFAQARREGVSAALLNNQTTSWINVQGLLPKLCSNLFVHLPQVLPVLFAVLHVCVEPLREMLLLLKP